MGIALTLPIPPLNQNNEDPGHAYPDVNAGMDCVPTSIASALTMFTGVQYYGDELIDAVYGPAYHGGTGASAFVDFCAARGVHLYSVDGSAQNLVALLHDLVQQGKPTLVTIPGQWNNPNTSGANPGNVTHVFNVCGEGPGTLRMMNPWIAPTWHDVTDAWLINKLVGGQIWPMERMNMTPSGWSDDGVTLTAPNGVPVRTGFRDYIRNNPWSPENVPLAPEYATASVEPLVNAATGAGSRLDCYECSLGYTVARGVFVLWIGYEIQALKQKLAAAPAQTPAPALDPLTAKVKTMLAADLPILQDWVTSI